MATKRTRAKRTSSGARKASATKHCNINRGRRGPAIAKQAEQNFIRTQKKYRWPTEDSMIKMAELALAKARRSRQKTKPMTQGFTMLDNLIDSPNLDRLLTAASLKLKRVRRYPGYVLQRVYNLKDRPIQII